LFLGANNKKKRALKFILKQKYFEIVGSYGGWNFNSGNYLFTTDTK